jgi:hypothetical protein
MYLGAIVAANLTTAWLGPWMSVVNAFLFIGLDLAARDHLHESWRHRGLFSRMLLLIGAGSLLSWFLSRDAGRVAYASFAAFAAAGGVDALVYHYLSERTQRLLTVNGSNTAAALVDSIIFPTLAFGFPLQVGVMALQFAAKSLGGLGWSLALRKAWSR